MKLLAKVTDLQKYQLQGASYACYGTQEMIIHDIDFEYGYSANSGDGISFCGDSTKGACVVESSFGNLVIEIDCISTELTIRMKGRRVMMPNDVCTDIHNLLRYDFLIAERSGTNALLLFGGTAWYVIDIDIFTCRKISNAIDLSGLGGSVSKVFSLNYVVIMCYEMILVLDGDFSILTCRNYPLGISQRVRMKFFPQIPPPSDMTPLLRFALIALMRAFPLIGGSRSRHFIPSKFYCHSVNFCRNTVISKALLLVPLNILPKTSFVLSWIGKQ